MAPGVEACSGEAGTYPARLLTQPDCEMKPVIKRSRESRSPRKPWQGESGPHKQFTLRGITQGN